MKKKLVPSLIAQIQRDRLAGVSYADLSERYGVSEGSIRNALTTPAPKKKGRPRAARSASPSEATAAPSGEPPTQDELRQWLGEQVTGLRADAERFRSEGNAPALAAANRALLAASALLTRVTPPDPREVPAGMVLVNSEEMRALGGKVEQRLMALVDDLFAEADTWPKCPTCSQRIPPKEFEK